MAGDVKRLGHFYFDRFYVIPEYGQLYIVFGCAEPHHLFITGNGVLPFLIGDTFERLLCVDGEVRLFVGAPGQNLSPGAPLLVAGNGVGECGAISGQA